MSRRPLGDTGLTTPPLVFGGNVFGWTADQASSFALLDACVDVGFDFIDTADVYSRLEPGFEGGESETVIGDWLRERGGRDRLVLSTKGGLEMGPGQSGLSRRYIKEAVEASLRRLGTDYIDLYHAHWEDPDTSLEETAEVFAELIQEGKVRAIGASNYDANRLAAALAAADRVGAPRFGVYQCLYNLYDREPFESVYRPICEQAGVAVLSYFSLASGFLTGKHRSAGQLTGNRRAMWLERYFDARGERILAALDQVAAARDASNAQVALAWLMAQPSIAAPIASATNLRQFEDLIKATSLQLSTEELAFLDTASATTDQAA
jgi:aryl-alcohol dehydrogenase-like predicted oxidoreductase